VSEFLVITGLSGAGRSQAADDLEDLGWFVVDNLPTSLIEKIGEKLADVAPEHYLVRTGERSYVVLVESEGKKSHPFLPFRASTAAMCVGCVLMSNVTVATGVLHCLPVSMTCSPSGCDSLYKNSPGMFG